MGIRIGQVIIMDTGPDTGMDIMGLQGIQLTTTMVTAAPEVQLLPEALWLHLTTVLFQEELLRRCIMFNSKEQT